MSAATLPRANQKWSPLDIGLSTVTGLLLAYAYLPIAVIVVLAFSEADLAVFPIKGWTVRWFAGLFNDEQILAGLRNSLVLGIAVVSVTVPLGSMLAYFMTRRVTARQAGWLTGAIILPMQTPRIIIGVLLLIFFGLIGLRPSLFTVFLSHVALTLPFATMIIASRLRGIDPALEAAAADLGAPTWRIWLEILLPLLGPAILAASLITFTISFDEMVVSYFTIGTESTLPIVIWSMLSYGYTQKINALGAVVIVPTLILLAAAQFLRSPRQVKPEV